jgi:uncharacterized protein YkwD
MPTFHPIPIRRAVTAALTGAMLLTLLPAATTMAAPEAPPAVRAAEWQVLAEMNRFRANHGLKPLRMAGGVRLVARERSRSMKNEQYFAHSSPAGVDAGDLLRRRSVQNHFWGENIGLTKYVGLDDGPRAMVDWWKDSPGHRWNMLYKGYNYAGIGIAKDGAQTYYTIVFANQRDHTPPMAGLVSSESGISVAATSGPRPVTVRWWGKDRPLSTRTAGLRGFSIQYRRAHGDWRTLRTLTASRQLTKELTRGSHQFRVRAIDKKGNRGSWMRPLTVTVN